MPQAVLPQPHPQLAPAARAGGSAAGGRRLGRGRAGARGSGARAAGVPPSVTAPWCRAPLRSCGCQVYSCVNCVMASTLTAGAAAASERGERRVRRVPVVHPGSSRLLGRGHRAANWCTRLQLPMKQHSGTLAAKAVALPGTPLQVLMSVPPHSLSRGHDADREGFISVDEFLRCDGGPHDVFAVGDVASAAAHPRPKAGVFAVRQGPALADNLHR